jgi:hypothetical protein
MPTYQFLWLNDEQRLFQGPNHPGQKHQEEPFSSGECRAFDLSVEDNQLLSKECVFGHEFGFVSGKVCQRPQQK